MAIALSSLYLRFRIHILMILAAGFGFGSALLWGSQIGLQTDRWMLRQFFQLRGPLAPPDNIAIVAIDDASLDQQTLILSRTVLAEGLERIANAKPKLLLIDAAFHGESSKNETNQKIARALSSVPSVISKTSPLDRVWEDRPSDRPPVDQLMWESAQFVLPMEVSATYGRVQFISVNKMGPPTLYSRVPLAESLPTELFDHSLAPPGKFDLINFYGEPVTFPTIALSDILNKDSHDLKMKLSDKIILIGFQATRDSIHTVNLDQFEISASPKPMYGVEIHATIIGNLLEKAWIDHIDPSYTAGGVLLISVLLLIVLVSTPALTGYLLILMFMLVLSIVNYLMFSWGRIWIGGLTTLWLIALCSITISLLCNTSYVKRIIGLRSINQIRN